MRGTPIKCYICHGTGRTTLSPVYEMTLKRLRRMGRATGADIARLMEVKATAVNNRLRALLRHGLVRVVEQNENARKVIYEAV